MPIFRLTKSLVFPPSHYAEPDGLLAIGGDLSMERLLLAYQLGIFPWYSDNTPIMWWSPDPRMVLFPSELKISASLRRVIRKGVFEVTADDAFRAVMENCASAPRRGGGGTWIVPEMVEAYCRLHDAGFAHSIESRREGRLVGGLYGVAIGRVFFGESMFALESDASKTAFAHLVSMLREWDFALIDCQVATAHLQSFGAREIPRSKFLHLLRNALESRFPTGPWKLR